MTKINPQPTYPVTAMRVAKICCGLWLGLIGEDVLATVPASPVCTVRADGLALRNGQTWPGVWWPDCGPFNGYTASDVRECQGNATQRRIFFAATNAMTLIGNSVDIGHICDGKWQQWSNNVPAYQNVEANPRAGNRRPPPNVTEEIDLVEMADTIPDKNGYAPIINITGCKLDPTNRTRLIVSTNNWGNVFVRNDPYGRSECNRLGFPLQGGGAGQNPGHGGPGFVPQPLDVACVTKQVTDPDNLTLVDVRLTNQCGSPVVFQWQTFADGTIVPVGTGNSGCVPNGGSRWTAIAPILGKQTEIRVTSVLTCP